jgi:hypothetical protein
MSSFIPSILESIHEASDPRYLTQKDEAKKAFEITGLISTAVAVGSVRLPYWELF